MCEHNSFKIAEIKKEFLGQTFKSKTQVCLNCQAELWDNKLSQEFNLWLNSFQSPTTLTYKVSDKTFILLKNLSLDFSFANSNQIVKAIAITFISQMSSPEFMKTINLLLETDFFIDLNSENKNIEQSLVISNPKFLYDLKSWESITSLSNCEILEVCLILALTLKNDSSLKPLWEQQKKLMELVLLD